MKRLHIAAAAIAAAVLITGCATDRATIPADNSVITQEPSGPLISGSGSGGDAPTPNTAEPFGGVASGSGGSGDMPPASTPDGDCGTGSGGNVGGGEVPSDYSTDEDTVLYA